jgi:hypothetical protein
LVAGRKRVPSPAAGKTAFRTLAGIFYSVVPRRPRWQLVKNRSLRSREKNRPQAGEAGGTARPTCENEGLVVVAQAVPPA